MTDKTTTLDNLLAGIMPNRKQYIDDFDENDSDYEEDILDEPSMVMSFRMNKDNLLVVDYWQPAENNEDAFDIAMSIIVREGREIDPSIRLDLAEKDLLEEGCWHYTGRKKIPWCVMIYTPKRLIAEGLSVVIDKKMGKHKTIKNYLKDRRTNDGE